MDGQSDLDSCGHVRKHPGEKKANEDTFAILADVVQRSLDVGGAGGPTGTG
jgi:hypothetical protein